MSVKGLENVKEALDKGLISEEDYSAAKNAFLRVEQLKMAANVGLLKEEDMSKAKDAFIEAVELKLQTLGGDMKVPEAAEEEEDDELAALPEKPSPIVTSRPPSMSAPPKPAAAALSPNPGNGAAQDHGGVFKPAREGAKSISGINVTQAAVDAFKQMKHKKKYRYLVFDIDYKAGLVILKDNGAYTAPYDDFLECLPDAECRYGIYDYDYTNDDGCKLSVFVFVMWSPDISSVKQKMLYASTKEYFRDCLDGTSVEIQATDISEIDADAIYEKVRSVQTRK